MFVLRNSNFISVFNIENMKKTIFKYFIFYNFLFWFLSDFLSTYLGFIYGIIFFPLCFLLIRCFYVELNPHLKNKLLIYLLVFIYYWTLLVGGNLLNYIFTDSDYFPMFDYRVAFIHFIIIAFFIVILLCIEKYSMSRK